MREFDLGPFLGEVSALETRSVSSSAAYRLLNVDVENGAIRPRRGYRNLRPAQTGFVKAYGLEYLQGYDSSYALVEEYVSFEDIGGTVKPFSRTAGTGTETEIDDGVGALSLDASSWRGFAWQDKAYFINRNESVARYTLGDANSWTFLEHPEGPATSLGWQVILNPSDSSTYDRLAFTGIDPATEITYTGSATATNSTLNSDNSLTIGHLANSKLLSSFKIDLNGATAGVQDWQKNDIIAFSLWSSVSKTTFDIDPASVRVRLINNDGSPKTLSPTSLQAIDREQEYCSISVRADFTGVARTDRDNIRYLEVEYEVTRSSGTASNNVLTINKPHLGCSTIAAPGERLPGQVMRFGYLWRWSSADFNSPIGGTVDIPINLLRGYAPIPLIDPLGSWLKFTFATTAQPNVDKVQLAWFDEEGKWRLVVEQSDGTTTYTHYMSYAELLALPYVSSPGERFEDVVGAAPFKGWVVWLFAGGQANVKHSRVGDPELLATDLDDLEDTNRGENFSLAENFADEPLGCAFACGDTCIIPGQKGMYAQFGNRPYEMSPVFRLPEAHGCANVRSAALWKDPGGNPGVVYVDPFGEGVWYVRGTQLVGDPSDWPRATELSAPIRGRFKTFILTEQAALGLTDFSTCKVFVDERLNAVWVVMGKRAWVLRRPALLDDNRYWHAYEFDTGGAGVEIAYANANGRNGLRWLREDGKFDEIEFNSSTSAWIEGTNRDAGAPMPQAYWQSQVLRGKNRRLYSARFWRSSLTDRPSIEVASTRQTSSVIQVASGERIVRFEPYQIGQEHQFKLLLPEDSGELYRVQITESAGAIGRRGE